MGFGRGDLEMGFWSGCGSVLALAGPGSVFRSGSGSASGSASAFGSKFYFCANREIEIDEDKYNII